MTIHEELVKKAKAAIDAVAADRSVTISARQDSLSEIAGEVEGHQESLAEQYATSTRPATEPATETYDRDFD